ncbi:hypothetical protein BKA65DRAFT_579587 [Rhexocercosporidium sp. MPI-PUGE-AT-0058]|nr:hypothetical protein BKA65DRAFT_579587 [Rhexocercosporidium sp. MPI-PUGE-AT-0058]
MAVEDHCETIEKSMGEKTSEDPERSPVDIEDLVNTAGLVEELQKHLDAVRLETEAADRKIASLKFEAEVNSTEYISNIAASEEQIREEEEAGKNMVVLKKKECDVDTLIREQIVGEDGILRDGEEKRRHPVHVKDALEIIRRVCKNIRYVEVYIPESNEDFEFEEYRGPKDWDTAVIELELRLKLGYETSLVRDKIEQEAIDYFDRRLTQEVHRFTSKILDRDQSKVLRIGDSHIAPRQSKTLDFGPWNREEIYELAQQTWEQIRGADARQSFGAKEIELETT